MRIIDTHVHIWTQDEAYPWADEPGTLPVAEAPPETLLALMDAQGVDGAVLVQYIGYHWDNRYVAWALREHPDRFRGVCRVDPQDSAAPDHLSYWTEVHGFQGVRLSPSGDAGGDWFAGPAMDALFGRAAALRVPVLILAKPSRLADLARILANNPETCVVLDHMADCVDGDPRHLERLLSLARFPRLYLKLSHIWVNSGEGYPWRDTHDRLRRVCDGYGAGRIMWGSDWPMCLRCAGYGEALSYLRDDTAVFSGQELAALLGGTALEIWPFD